MGVFGHPHASELTYLGLFALQHRGQESAGIVSTDGAAMFNVRGMGLVSDVFNDHTKFNQLSGNRAIGHVRYSTAGGSTAANIQPLLVKTKDGPLAVAHNGNLVNARNLRTKLENEGAIFQTDSDSELFVHLISRSREATLAKRVAEAMSYVQGAYSLIFLSRDEMVVARDPHGFRPLCLGGKGDAVIAASETCALDLTEATYVRDVEPGEVITISATGLESMTVGAPSLHMCVFELIYFARPDSRIFGSPVDRSRRKLGKILAQEAPADADIVISVPDSSNTSALGYARQSGLKFELGLIRNHYIGRTFINPSPFMRSFNARVKYNPVPGVLKDKRIVIVEDSIVRGTTLKKLVALLRRAGVKEIHIRVASPPIQFPCFYGMDFPTRKELIAAWNTPEQIREYLGVDSLKYISVEGMLAATYDDPGHYCTACFTGNYPIPLPEEESQELFQYSNKEWARHELERVLRSLD
ncbi:MAG: amidophosphoribosyltransferase [Calditrichota bacterium]